MSDLKILKIENNTKVLKIQDGTKILKPEGNTVVYTGGIAIWGQILGAIENQTDLINLINDKSLQKISVIAGEQINSYRAIKIVSNEAFYFNDDINDYGKCIGISLQSVNQGDAVEIFTHGELTMPFALIDGNIYYANANGNINNTQGLVLSQKIGTAISTSKLFVKIEESLIL